MRFIKITSFIALLSFLTACNVTINPIGVLELDNEDIVFDFVRIGEYDEVTLNLSNVGQSHAQIVSFRLKVGDYTGYDEFSIEPSVMPTKFLLEKNESQPFTIKFTPETVGDKSATLVIQVIMYDESTVYEFPVSGKAYAGKISLYPAVYGFEHSYIGEKREKEFTIANPDTRALTVKSITFADYKINNPSTDSFNIKSGWNNTPIVIEPYKFIKIIVEFNPVSLNYKAINIFVQIEESDYTAQSMVAANCCDIMKIQTSKLPNGIHGYEYAYNLNTTGGNRSYSYGISEGLLPEGLRVCRNQIVGNPEEHGDFDFTLIVVDTAGHQATKELSIHINYAMLYRDPADEDPAYVFDRDDYRGLYTVNLICEGDIPLQIKELGLESIGFNSGEAQILTHNIPKQMQPGQKLTLDIQVESLLDEARYAVLRVEHSGYDTDFIQAFEWDIVHDTKAIFVIERSDDMDEAYTGDPIFDLNDDIILNPTKLQYAQYCAYKGIANLHPGDKFDVIVFGDYVTTCFGELRDADQATRKFAIDWLFGINPHGHSNMYDALLATYNNYGPLDKVELYTVGEPDTAVSLGCDPGDCADTIGAKIKDDLMNWIQPSVAWYKKYLLRAIQVGGGSLTDFMNSLRSVQKTVVQLH